MFSWVKLPLITGYIFTGILAGPFVLNLIPEDQIRKLNIVDHVALAFIAFAAGSKLVVRDLIHKARSIALTTFLLVVVDYAFGTALTLIFASQIGFMQDMSLAQRFAVSILMGTLMVARSPASAIAIVEELKASGPFTDLCIGVTVVMDMIVIVVFAINLLIADSLMESGKSGGHVFITTILQLLISVAGGALLGRIFLPLFIWGWERLLPARVVAFRRVIEGFQAFLFLLSGFGLFVVEQYANEYVEPLILSMVAGFVIANYTPYQEAFLHTLHLLGPGLFVAFFTLTGAALDFTTIGGTILLSASLFAIRVLGIFIASYLGGWLAGEDEKRNRVAWLGYLTQAGVALGLAKKIHLRYPDWGSNFTTVIVSVVIVNQLVGPPLFKWVIRYLNEAHVDRDLTAGTVTIFAEREDDEALQAASMLSNKGWNVRRVHLSSLLAPAVGTVSPLIESERVLDLLDPYTDALVVLLPDHHAAQLLTAIGDRFPSARLVIRTELESRLRVMGPELGRHTAHRRANKGKKQDWNRQGKWTSEDDELYKVSENAVLVPNAHMGARLLVEAVIHPLSTLSAPPPSKGGLAQPSDHEEEEEDDADHIVLEAVDDELDTPPQTPNESESEPRGRGTSIGHSVSRTGKASVSLTGTRSRSESSSEGEDTVGGGQDDVELISR